MEKSNELVPVPDGNFAALAYLDGLPIMKLVVPKSVHELSGNDVRPTGQEVDCVAAFIEAAEELEREPFFGPDEKRSCSGGGSGMQIFHLGDRFHFRSALISFRRIWMTGESSNFYKIYGILWRFAQNVPQRVQLHWARGFVKQQEDGKKHYPLEYEITGNDLVALWINTVFAHAGQNPKHRHKRADFDTIGRQCGHGPLEFAFRMIVWSLGLQYITVAKDCARPILEGWKERFQIEPSFHIGAAFGTATRERTKEGHVIVRKASTEFGTEETFDQRLTRILDRSEFKDLQFVFKNIDIADKNLVRLVLKFANVEEMFKYLGYELTLVDKVSFEFHHYGAGFRAFTGLYDGQRRSGLHVGEMVLVTDGTGMEVLNASLDRLKGELLKG